MATSTIFCVLAIVCLLNFTALISVSGDDSAGWDHFVQFSGCHKGQFNVTGLDTLKKYLHRFGYMGDESNYSDDFDDSLESAIMTYQQNFDLNTTGILDTDTVQQMIQPRCGVSDIINGSSSMNSGRRFSAFGNAIAHYSFFPGSPKWPDQQQIITYALSTTGLPFASAQLSLVFARAFARWSDATPLNFTETSDYSSADIKIAFFKGDHGDGSPFDGALGTLAHAFSPPSGKFHLDGDENWVIGTGSSSSVDLESVAVHEIGHLLGLGHSSNKDAIMFPTIRIGEKKVGLHVDDVQGIQALYGKNPNNKTIAATTTSTSEQSQNSSGESLTIHGSFIASWCSYVFALLILIQQLL